jgi:flagellar hook protein FlgE
MIRSLRTGVSGLKSNQVRMDVTGNNIANVNTIAFKRNRAAFNEVLGQQLLGVGRTAGGTGINPSFVGLGVSVGSIDQNWTQGALENTGVATDLALSGDGFFVAKAGDRTLLTRAGNFTFNRDGELVTSNGLNVQGWRFADDGTMTTGALSSVKIDPNAAAPAKRTEQIKVGGNLSADAAIGHSTTVSTVVYDARGRSQTITIEMVRSETLDVAGQDSWDITIRDAEGNEIDAGISRTLHFNHEGRLIGISRDGVPDTDLSIAFRWDIDGDNDPLDRNTWEAFELAFGDEEGGFVTQHAGSSTATVREQNGQPAGSVVGYSINPEGVLELNFSNGQQQKLFQLALGNVNNPNGLEQVGENFYQLTSASGDLQLGRAGRDLSTSVVAGTLEMSNVDLASEFTEMIVTQRGYQASARVITTSDELLQETVQLKR